MFFFRLLSRLPLSVLYILSDILYLIARYVISYRKKVIDENLKFAFPEKSPEERKKIRNKFYRNFTDAFFAETIKMLTISEKELKKRFQLTNQDQLDSNVINGVSTIVMIGHLFNWEMAILGVASRRKIIAETVYLKINNKFFNQLMLAIRTSHGGIMTEKSDFRKSMFTLRSNPRIVHLAADQRPANKENRYQRLFLNRPAYFFEGGEFMAKKMNLPVFFAFMTKIKRGHYKIQFNQLAVPPYDSDQPHSITDEFCSRLEDNIKSQPDLYLWSHKRWKV